LRRLVALDRMLRERRYPNSCTAAKELEVSSRTIYRDLDFLRDSLGAPLEFCRRHNGFYYRDATYTLPLVQLTEGELVALLLAERMLQEYRGTPYAADLARAFAKLTIALQDHVTIDPSHLAEAFSFRQPGSTAGDPALFRRLARAVQQGRQL